MPFSLQTTLALPNKLGKKLCFPERAFPDQSSGGGGQPSGSHNPTPPSLHNKAPGSKQQTASKKGKRSRSSTGSTTDDTNTASFLRTLTTAELRVLVVLVQQQEGSSDLKVSVSSSTCNCMHIASQTVCRLSETSVAFEVCIITKKADSFTCLRR